MKIFSKKIMKDIFRTKDLDITQSSLFKPLALKHYPNVLTLTERPLHFLDLERSPPLKMRVSL
jgi:hypothetical protein